MNFTPDIFDFYSNETFLKLQNAFLSNNYGHLNNTPESFDTVEIVDFDIYYYTVTKRKQKCYEKIFFYGDFLENEIPKLSENEILKIENELNSTFKFKKEERKLYLEDFLDRLLELDRAIYSVVFLNSNYKFEVLWEIKKIIEFIKADKVWKNEKDDSKKIKLRLSRAEVAGLFFLLHQKGLTQSQSFSELGRLIKENIMCYDEISRSYKEITTPDKLLHGFKNGDKPLETAATNLKNLLSDPKFYELKI